MKYHKHDMMKYLKENFMKCYVCGDDAIKRFNINNLCAKHQRFIQMRRTARTDKKYVPSIYEIEKLVPKNMICQDCGIQMHWIDNENRSSGAVLQHYRNGTLGIVCMSCNSKHGVLPGDMYKEIPKDHKLCSSCKTIKPLLMFSVRRDGKKPYPLSKCKSCSLKAHKDWREKNPQKYQEANKRNNDKRKENIEEYREYERKKYWERKLKNEKLSSI